MAKKKNPSVSLKASDIRRMKREITNDAVRSAFIIMFTVLHDKWEFDHEDLAKVLKQTTELAEMINQTPHHVTIEQLEKVLREELNIKLK